MKNKEIEYLLNEMKDTTQDYIGTNGCKYQDLLREEIDLLLSYIEQLEKENEKTRMRNDMLRKDINSFIKDYKIDYKSRIDKAIELLNELSNLYNDNYTVSDKAKDVIDILKGGSDE